MKNKKKGFTLIELLVVIAIIGVFAAIATPIVVGNQSDKGVAEDTLKGVLDNTERLVNELIEDKTIKIDPKVSGFTINGKTNPCGDTAFFGENSANFSPKMQALYSVAYMLVNEKSKNRIETIDYVYFENESSVGENLKWSAKGASPFVKEQGASSDFLNVTKKKCLVELSVVMSEKNIEEVQSVKVKLVAYSGEKAMYFYRFDYMSQKQVFRPGSKKSLQDILKARTDCIQAS